MGLERQRVPEPFTIQSTCVALDPAYELWWPYVLMLTPAAYEHMQKVCNLMRVGQTEEAVLY